MDRFLENVYSGDFCDNDSIEDLRKQLDDFSLNFVKLAKGVKSIHAVVKKSPIQLFEMWW